jgi:hypothetical protein
VSAASGTVAGLDGQQGERTALLRELNIQRGHIVGILDGLDEQTVDRALLPSGWTFRGMLAHLAFDDERFWCRAVLAAEPAVTAAVLGVEPYAWNLLTEKSLSEVIDVYRNETERGTAIIEHLDLDAAPAWWPQELFGDWRLATNRGVILHLIGETACHAGHLDAARELLDGRQWIVLADEEPHD